MKKLLFAMVFGVVCMCHAGDGLFWSATTNATGAVVFYRSTVMTPGAAVAVIAKTPVRYLRLVNGSVVQITKAEQDAQDAQEAKDAADAQAAAATAADIATSNAAVKYAAEMQSYSNQLSDLEQFDQKTKLWFKALVVEINARLATNKITEAQLKARVEAIR